MAQYQKWETKIAQDIISQHLHLEGPLLPILHALNHEFGYIHNEADSLISDALNISQAEVRGTISFYHDFARSPSAPHQIKLCRAEACQSQGCEMLVDHLRDHHKISLDDAKSNHAVSVKTVYCLGNCALGPSLMVDDHIIGRVDTFTLDTLLGNPNKLSHPHDLIDEARS
jgi:formate dehydrogenase subunit gamma